MKITTTVFGALAIMSAGMVHAHEDISVEMPDFGVHDTVQAVDLAQILNVDCGEAFGCTDSSAAVTEVGQEMAGVSLDCRAGDWRYFWFCGGH